MKGRRVKRIGEEKGYAFIETMVAASLSLMVAAAAMSFGRLHLFVLVDGAKQLKTQVTARGALDLFARELRHACAVSVADSNEIRFQSDLDTDGVIDQDLTYASVLCDESPCIIRVDHFANETEPVIQDFVLGGGLSYFDGNGNVLATGPDGLTAAQIAAVRRIRIDLEVSGSASAARSLQPRAKLGSDVDLRNRFFVNTMGAACAFPAG
jgi:hypothetical protein